MLPHVSRCVLFAWPTWCWCRQVTKVKSKTTRERNMLETYMSKEDVSEGLKKEHLSGA